MPKTTIVLKDEAAADVTFTLVDDNGSLRKYVSPIGETLLGGAEIQLRLSRKPNVNRIMAKLSLPTVCTDDCGKSTVSFTEVGSIDLSSVLQAPEATRLRFAALFGSLAASNEVAEMFTDGVMPL